ncbi:MAG: nuclear transport factor 2 family protein [Novosphingobium sp.]|nr:nuclear transport factor 2 family protein [Novosphingobium sp.]
MAREMISQGNGIFEFTAQHHHNNDVKTRFVDALFRNDWDAIAPLVHPDFELREPAALAYGGIYKGIEGFKQCWELIPKIGHKTERLTTLRNHFTEDPDSMVVELETSGVHNETGEKFTSKVMEQFEFKDGLVIAIVLYWFDIP